MTKNHFASNIITRGNMNISALTKGFILPNPVFIIRRKRGGGSSVQGPAIKGFKELEKELLKIRKEDIDAIEVYVDWNKDVEKYGKEVYVELIEKKVSVELLKYTNEKLKIEVELI